MFDSDVHNLILVKGLCDQSVRAVMRVSLRMCVHIACENVRLDLGSGNRSASGPLPTRSNAMFY